MEESKKYKQEGRSHFNRYLMSYFSKFTNRNRIQDEKMLLSQAQNRSLLLQRVQYKSVQRMQKYHSSFAKLREPQLHSV